MRPIGGQTQRIYFTCGQEEDRHREYTSHAANRRADTENILHMRPIGGQKVQISEKTDVIGELHTDISDNVGAVTLLIF
jgi:hypothetical protein